jgi:hypothetical protein
VYKYRRRTTETSTTPLWELQISQEYKCTVKTTVLWRYRQTDSSSETLVKGNGKVVPLQALTGP